ncbi:uncharacterized protein CIMG_02393 [Coccidioides immitis RS]|uniref:Uncharacterized protein n=4 Tax=Coccidioides immitis TaxID=5501 RepID=A0A0E1S0T3_COCIM|nr:uncharacterized protein CIMG_02393 [Coccidioides immitis RS]EAS37039.2 hypothetical protein CIMG_02393 [Coccidioides immitis RS]TPX24935.1 hypothetical protein DIZ76_010384 [Coccidioides immitis]
MEPSSDNTPIAQRPGTPPRPPVSPVTPVMTHTNLFPVADSEGMIPPPVVQPPEVESSIATPDLGLAPHPRNSTGSMAPSSPPQISPPRVLPPEPAPVPISESDNPDAIALRSAISVLQIQKQQTLRDIRTLEKLKQAAAENPEAFAKDVVKGDITVSGGEMDIFQPQFQDQDGDKQSPGVSVDGDHQKQSEHAKPAFSKIPKPQDIVRMPPINWAKYHIVGEPLDKLHEEQRQRPSPGEPRKDVPIHVQKAPEHVIAAPYRPFTDKLDTPMKTRSSNKRKNEQG